MYLYKIDKSKLPYESEFIPRDSKLVTCTDISSYSFLKAAKSFDLRTQSKFNKRDYASGN